MNDLNMKHYKILFIVCILIIGLSPIASYYLFKPRNSLELYQYLRFSKDFEKAEGIVLEGYESNFNLEEYDIITGNLTPYTISQFTLFQYGGKTLLIETTPGRKKMKILRVIELPEDIHSYFSEITK